jgi:hypothetical protein
MPLVLYGGELFEIVLVQPFFQKGQGGLRHRFSYRIVWKRIEANSI